MQLYKIILGDWSCDGHNQSTQYIIKCNKTPAEVQSALKSVGDRIGMNIARELCADYEEGYIWINTVDRILALTQDNALKNKLLSCLSPFEYDDDMDVVFKDWTEGELTLEIYNTIPKEAVVNAWSLYPRKEEVRFSFDVDSFLEFLMTLVRIELPDMLWEIQEEPRIPTMLKGYGYGFYH
jgi:hypothetical protein